MTKEQILLEALLNILAKVPEGDDYDPGQFVMDVDTIANRAIAAYEQGGDEPKDEYITLDKYRELAEGLDKPALNLLKNSGVVFEKWGDNINRLIEKELGLEKTVVYKRVSHQ